MTWEDGSGEETTTKKVITSQRATHLTIKRAISFFKKK